MLELNAITIKAAAAQLGRSRTAIEHQIRIGNLRVENIGWQRLIKNDVWQEFLDLYKTGVFSKPGPKTRSIQNE